MFGHLFLLFVCVPLLDLYLLIRIGQVLTFGPTLALVIITGLIGAALARRQGLRTLARINAELQAGRMPTSELADGLLILLAGAVLITPGFLTDLFGLALLVPPVRAGFKHVLARYFQSRIQITHIQPPGAGFPPSGPAGPFSTPRGPFVDADGPFEGRVGLGGRPMKHVENEAIDK